MVRKKVRIPAGYQGPLDWKEVPRFIRKGIIDTEDIGFKVRKMSGEEMSDVGLNDHSASYDLGKKGYGRTLNRAYFKVDGTGYSMALEGKRGNLISACSSFEVPSSGELVRIDGNGLYVQPSRVDRRRPGRGEELIRKRRTSPVHAFS